MTSTHCRGPTEFTLLRVVDERADFTKDIFIRQEFRLNILIRQGLQAHIVD